MSIYRKWLRLSLRSAVLITTIACIWLGWQAHINIRQARALAQIRELGGNVQAYTVKSSLFARLINQDGSVNAGEVTDVAFLGAAIGDSDIDEVARCARMFPRLERITLTDTAVTREGEGALRAKLPNLQIKVITLIDGLSTPVIRYKRRR